MVLCFAKESQLRHSSVDNYFLQRYNKKYTYASPLNKKIVKHLHDCKFFTTFAVEIKNTNMLQIIKDKEYTEWIAELSHRYRQSQIKASVRVNNEMLHFY